MLYNLWKCSSLKNHNVWSTPLAVAHHLHAATLISKIRQSKVEKLKLFTVKLFATFPLGIAVFAGENLISALPCLPPTKEVSHKTTSSWQLGCSQGT